MDDLENQAAESREGSYYELALTNRQVFVAVVLFLASLSGAFLGGIWFARDATPPSIGPQASATSTAAAKPSPDGLDEYRFFSENRAAPASASPPAAPAPPPARPEPTTTLAEDVGARPGASGAAGAGEEPSPAADPVPAQPEPKPTASTPSKPPAPAPSAPASARPVLTDLWVQVFSSADAAQARRVVEQLKRAGYRGSVSPAPGGGSAPLQRVRIGPYKDREQAQRVADDVRRKLKFSTWITSTQ